MGYFDDDPTRPTPRMPLGKAVLILLCFLFGLPLVALVFIKYIVSLWQWLAPLG